MKLNNSIIATDTAAIPSARPHDRHLFAPARDNYGTRLALVFGNQALGGECPYYTAGRCHHCDIGAGEGAAFTTELNRRRLAWYQLHYRHILPETAHLVLYNSGSLLNRREMPPELLDELLAWAVSLPALKVVSVESREAFITSQTVRQVASAMGSNKSARVILGLESSDDRVRNEVLEKYMPLAAITRAIESAGEVAAEIGRDRIGLTFNVLVGGPGTTPDSAVADAVATATFALDACRAAGIAADLNLHPYYRSARSKLRFPAHRPCSLQTAASATIAVAELAAARTARCSLFVGTYDEGHDQDGSRAQNEAVREAMARFNETQDREGLRLLCRV